MSIQETDKLDSARRQGQAQFDSIREMVNALQTAENRMAGNVQDEISSPDDDERAADDARQAIEEDALSVEVRSGWNDPSSWSYADARDKPKPEEYRILLCAGGPAVQIIGELSECGEPETARLQVQDWFTPWTDFRPLVDVDNYDSEPILLAYARCFYFGE